ncbi:MAG: ferritin-like domain-containing protein [Rickettsiales bacterium]|nr:ferritin-like domain-containing protein [Rickettsiales bacterium]
MYESKEWNRLLGAILASIHQHFLHARILKHQGYMELADHEYRWSIESMRQADLLIEHMLAEGDILHPEASAPSSIETTPAAIIAADKDRVETLKKAVSLFLQKEKCENALLLLAVIQKSLIEQEHFLIEWQDENGHAAASDYAQLRHQIGPASYQLAQHVQFTSEKIQLHG